MFSEPASTAPQAACALATAATQSFDELDRIMDLIAKYSAIVMNPATTAERRIKVTGYL